jgi:hydroxymethylbilane synthase
MSNTISIGTRDSELAMWQAHKVKTLLESQGYSTILKPVKSTGDLNLEQPLYEMGITGIFTKTLDIAMLSGKIDIAVHSMKDVPTSSPKGIVEAAVLKRANSKDVLIHKGLDFFNAEGTIATGSLRRKAQWLNKYPTHTCVDLRGNVNTRLQKLEDSNWNGAIFAAAGLERLNIRPENYLDLDWMLPAPAQGAMLVVAMEKDLEIREVLKELNHRNSEICVNIERDFLKILEGGCSAPIGALATIDGNEITFKGALFSLDGKKKITVERKVALEEAVSIGKECARKVRDNGGRVLMADIQNVMN